MITHWHNGRNVGGEKCEFFTDGAYFIATPAATAIERHIDLAGDLVIPGGIDTHVHVRDMELAHKETWESASAAAAAGGITTIFDMPNTVPPTINEFGLRRKREVARRSLVNWGIHFGAIEENEEEMRKAENIGAYKLFLARSSSAFPIPNREQTKAIFVRAAERGLPVIVHSECQDCLDSLLGRYPGEAIYHNAFRAPHCAHNSTRMILELCREVGNHLHIAHTSTRAEWEMIATAKDRGDKVTAEVTPHHLLLNEERLRQSGNFGKVNPPLRSEDDRRATWEALSSGLADSIGSDHAPHTRSEKEQPYEQSPSGFPGLETALPLLLGAAVERGQSAERIITLLTRRPAELFRINKRGWIKPGNYADFAVFERSDARPVRASEFHSLAKYSPYEGEPMRFKTRMTVINGTIAYENGQFLSGAGREVEFAEN
jgi:dihydroorotase